MKAHCMKQHIALYDGNYHDINSVCPFSELRGLQEVISEDTGTAL
jgi:hypothetical protein